VIRTFRTNPSGSLSVASIGGPRPPEGLHPLADTYPLNLRVSPCHLTAGVRVSVVARREPAGPLPRDPQARGEHLPDLPPVDPPPLPLPATTLPGGVELGDIVRGTWAILAWSWPFGKRS
jgi:hypothetical protein